jgi:hypothetical protein
VNAIFCRVMMSRRLVSLVACRGVFVGFSVSSLWTMACVAAPLPSVSSRNGGISRCSLRINALQIGYFSSDNDCDDSDSHCMLDDESISKLCEALPPLPVRPKQTQPTNQRYQFRFSPLFIKTGVVDRNIHVESASCEPDDSPPPLP